MVELDYSVRYTHEYKTVLIPAAHKATGNKCCWCMRRKSKEVHHALYGKDKIGVSIFPVCLKCHSVLHLKVHWIHDFSDPVWKNRNTKEVLNKLQSCYLILTLGSNNNVAVRSDSKKQATSRPGRKRNTKPSGRKVSGIRK